MKRDIILSLDTSSWQLSMCVYKSNKFYSKIIQTEDHSETLVKCLDKLLKKINSDLTQISYIGVNIGPGSFTGLRVGLSFVKTLALNLGLKVICVNSFNIILYEFMKKYKLKELKKNLKVVVFYPSVKNEFYFCRYLFNDGSLKVLDNGYVKNQDIINKFSTEFKLVIPENIEELDIQNKFEVFKLKFNSSNTIIKIFIENEKNLYKLVKPKELFPLYIRHTYY